MPKDPEDGKDDANQMNQNAACKNAEEQLP